MMIIAMMNHISMVFDCDVDCMAKANSKVRSFSLYSGFMHILLNSFS